MDVLDENQVHAKYKETTNKQLPLVDMMVHPMHKVLGSSKEWV